MNQADLDFRAKYVEPYLPARIFDAHAHLFCRAHCAPGTFPDAIPHLPHAVGIDIYRESMEWLHPHGRTIGGVFFGFGFRGDRTANDDFVAQEEV